MSINELDQQVLIFKKGLLHEKLILLSDSQQRKFHEYFGKIDNMSMKNFKTAYNLVDRTLKSNQCKG